MNATILMSVIQIRKNIFKKLFYHRCRNLTSIVNPLWMIDDAKREYLRIICRRKANKRCNIFTAPSRQSLTRGGLSAGSPENDVGRR